MPRTWLRVNAVGFAYSPERVPEEAVPHTAMDFLDPRLLARAVYHLLSAGRRRDAVPVGSDRAAARLMDRLMVNRPQFIRGHLGVVREIMANRAGVSFDSTLSSTIGPQNNGADVRLVISDEDALPISASERGHLPRRTPSQRGEAVPKLAPDRRGAGETSRATGRCGRR